MAYIESFLYYLLIVGSVFIALYVSLLFIVFIFKSIKNKENFQIFGISDLIVSTIKSRVLKIFTLFYIAAFSIFYFLQLSNYLGDERAYPKAKAYKIVADISMFYFDFFIANRNLYFKPSGLKYIQPYEKWQKFLMRRAFEYIPKDDAERAIWQYEYYYANYVRANTAPIDFNALDQHDLKMLLELGGYTTLYKPIAKEMIQDVGILLDALMRKPMQDKYYDEVNRYATVVMLGSWWERNKSLYYSLGAKNPKCFTREERLSVEDKLDNDATYLSRVRELAGFLNEVKEHVGKSKRLQSFLRDHTTIYPELMALRVRLFGNLLYIDLLHERFSCEMPSILKYFQYKQEFLSNTEYKKFDFHERVMFEDFFQNVTQDYILYKFCNIKAEELVLKVYDHYFETREDLIKLNPKTKKILQRIEDER